MKTAAWVWGVAVAVAACGGNQGTMTNVDGAASHNDATSSTPGNGGAPSSANGGATANNGGAPSTANGGATANNGGAPSTANGGAPANNGGAPAAGTGGASGAWRPFRDDSPWNSKIANNPALDGGSADLVADMAKQGAFWINIQMYSVPVYYVDAGTPAVTVTVLPGIAGTGFDNNRAQVPIPTNAMAAAGSDEHLCIVAKAQNTAWDFWQAMKASAGWTCVVCMTADLAGSGSRPPKITANPWYASAGARASGFPLIAGLVRVDEMKAGAINHALVVGYQHVRTGVYTPPASTPQGITPGTTGMPLGAHLQLDPTLDITTLGLSPAGVVIARAMQDYGLFVGDLSGAVSLYAEASAESQQQFAGVLANDDAAKIPVGKLRLLKMDPLYQAN